MRILATERRPERTGAPRVVIDYDRRVHGLFGLIFDVVAVNEAVERLVSAIMSGKRCHLATPNANFLRLARKDPHFRDALLTCDLSTLDGMPLVLLARALGIRANRASGADVFEALQHDRRRKVRAFFFGGDAETGRRLRDKLDGDGVVCVGAAAPPFGPIDEATTEEAIAAINAGRVDLLSVSVGARNGVAWIAGNERRLTPPILANLGAVIHYATGGLPRAPHWMRRCGLEWLWRIVTEPALASRYARDGLDLASIVLFRLVPSMALSRLLAWSARPGPRRISVSSDSQGTCLALAGAWREENLEPLRRTLEAADRAGGDLTIVCDEIALLDTAALGLILLACGAQRRRGRGFVLKASQWPLRAWLSANGCRFLLSDSASSPDSGRPAFPSRDRGGEAQRSWGRAQAPASR